MIKRLLVLLIVPVLFYSLTSLMLLAASGCQVPSIINSQTTLSPSDCSEYIQGSNVIVREGATLKIEPGTIIRVDGLHILLVEGQLLARGTAENPIHITSNQSKPQKGDWGHIFFDSTSTNATFDESGNYEAGSILQHAIVEYGGGIPSDSRNGVIIANIAAPFIDHVTIRHNERGAVRVRGGFLFSNEDIKVTNNLINENGNGHCVVDIDNLAATTVTNNRVISNTGSAICVSFGDSVINRNVVTLNAGWGLIVDGSDAMVSNNVVMSNTQGGIFHGSAYANINHNTIVANRGSNGAGLKVTSFASGSREVTIYANTILSNTASSSGGGLYLGCTLYPYDIRENVIRGNRVSGEEGSGGGVMLVIPCEKANFTFNDIYDNEATYGYGLYNASGEIDARLNYWGTQNESEIEDAIYHQPDSLSFGFVDYTSYLSKPISELPRLYLPATTR